MVKWKVYISSTYKDLKEYRMAIKSHFNKELKSKFELTEIMEHMYDKGAYVPFVQDCINAVKECHIYIIILGNKVGSNPPNNTKTYTEIEFETAKNNSKKIFCFRLEEFDILEIDNNEKHNEILNQFEGYPIHKFKNFESLENILYKNLIQFASENPILSKNPYKGLDSYEVDDGNRFFGRDSEIKDCLKRITLANSNYFVSVIGNSGTGKSSFVKAGLLYQLKHKEEYRHTNHLQFIITPGNTPYTNLCYELELKGISDSHLKYPDKNTPKVILYFDQFEEVITQCRSVQSKDEVTKLFNLFDKISKEQKAKNKILIICSFRSDFLSDLVNFDFIRSKQYYFPLSSLDYKVHSDNWEKSIEQIIQNPAKQNGVTIKRELVDRLINELKEVEGALPILQFTLQQIWTNETIKDGVIDSSEYDSISKSEGISGLIQIHAEKVIQIITNNERDGIKMKIVKSIFVNLVEVSENQNDVRRTVNKTDLLALLESYPTYLVQDVFEKLVTKESRLLSVTSNQENSINVSLIHEELIRKWDRLKRWINDRRDSKETQKRILLDVRANERGEINFYNRKDSIRAFRWSKQNPDLANESIKSFLKSSQKRNNKRILLQFGASIFTLILVTTIYFKIIVPNNQEKEIENLEGIIEDNFSDLNSAINIDGGIKKLKYLEIDEENYGFLKEKLNLFENLTTISISHIDKLSNLNFLKSIENPELVENLRIYNNDNLENLNGIEKFRNLTSLIIDYNNKLKDINTITHFNSLNSLSLTMNENLIDIKATENLDSLILLEISDLGKRRNKAILKNKKYLKSLFIFDCKDLRNLHGAENYADLVHMEITGSNNLQSLNGIQKFKNLKTLKLKEVNDLKDLNGLEELDSLSLLEISSANHLVNIDAIKNHNSLTTLTFSRIDSIRDLNILVPIDNLQAFSISYCKNLKEVNGIELLKNVTSLDLFNNIQLSNINGVTNLNKLTFLQLNDNPRVKNINIISTIKTLNSLSISSLEYPKTPSDFKELKNLSYLKIWGSHDIYDLDGIGNLKDLRSLYLFNLNDLRNIQEIRKLEKLTLLNISNVRQLTNLNEIKQLANLKSLALPRNRSLIDISGIERLDSLTFLDISDNSALNDISSIIPLNNLTTLFVDLRFRHFIDKIIKSNDKLKVQYN